MELLYWKPVKRKRSREIPYNDPEFVLGFDLDIEDFKALVAAYNKRQLDREEETRLYNHVRTMLSVVFENPSINPKGLQEKADCADAMFLDMWNSLGYIKPGASPYSYMYRAGYTAACRFFKKKISDRKKEEAIQKHLWECFRDYKESQSDGKVRNVDPE